MKVCEIFTSIEGEGMCSGYPTVFVRFHSCNLTCNWCDSRYACEARNLVKAMNVNHAYLFGA